MSLHDPVDNEYELQCLHHQISDARSYFGQQIHELHPNYMRAEGLRSAAAPESIDDNKSGVFSVIKLEKEVAANVQQDLDKATECMMGLTALGTAFCQRAAAQANNPELLFDTETWKSVLVHYPLLGPFSFNRSGYSKSIRGLELSGEFLKQLLGFAGSGAVLAAFQAFIASFGEKISAGVDTSNKPFHFAANTIFIDAKQVGNNWTVFPHLKMFFCDFSSKQRKVFTSCSSATMVDVKLDYIEVDTIWNYQQYKSNAQVQQRFDQLIGKSAVKQIEDSDNFFNGLI